MRSLRKLLIALALAVPAVAWAGVNHDALLDAVGCHCPICHDGCPCARK